MSGKRVKLKLLHNIIGKKMYKVGSKKYKEQMMIHRMLFKMCYKICRKSGSIISSLKSSILFINTKEYKEIFQKHHLGIVEDNILADCSKYYQDIVDDLQKRIDNGTYDEDDIRVCSECGIPMHEGYYLAGEYACDIECCLEQYDNDEAQMKEDLSHASEDNSDVYYTEWESIFYDD